MSIARPHQHSWSYLGAAALVVAGLGLTGCGSSSEDGTPGDQPPASQPSADQAPPTGPPPGLARGTSEGVNVTTSAGGAHVQLNDDASPEVRAAVDGNPVSISCRTDAGETIDSDEREWPSGDSSVTLQFTPAGTITECTVSASGTEVATAEMSPVG